jgi:hypothetical protein
MVPRACPWGSIGVGPFTMRLCPDGFELGSVSMKWQMTSILLDRNFHLFPAQVTFIIVISHDSEISLKKLKWGAKVF